MKPRFHQIGNDLWFLGIYSNNFEDREKEILTWESHLAYAKWLDETGVKPVVTLLHQPQVPDIIWNVLIGGHERGLVSTEELNTAIKAIYQDFSIAETVKVIPINQFMVVLAKVFPDKVEAANKLANKDVDWGMSHGFIPLNVDGSIITSYKSWEFSLVPIEIAANAYTFGGFNGMEEKQIRQEDIDLIEEVFGTGTYEKLANATDVAKQQLSSVLASKLFKSEEEVVEEVVVEEETPVVEEVVEVQQPTFDYDRVRNQIMVDLNTDHLEKVLKSMGETLEVLVDKVGELEQRQKALEVDDDTKIAQQFNPINWGVPQFSIARGKSAGEDEAPDVEQLKEKAVADNTPSDDDVLYTGFYKFMGFGSQQ